MPARVDPSDVTGPRRALKHPKNEVRPTQSPPNRPVRRRAGASPVSDFTDTPANRRSGGSAVETTPVWNQMDPQWGRHSLGRRATIGRAGCAMTATAMAASQISGRHINPGELDHLLDTHGGYSGDGLRWDRAAAQFGLSTHEVNARTSAGMNTLNRELDAGRPVVVGVDYKAGSRGGANGTDHYIALTGRSRDAQGHSVYYANDPAGGRRITLVERNGRLTEQNAPSRRRPYVVSGPAHVFVGGHGATGAAPVAPAQSSARPTATSASTSEEAIRAATIASRSTTPAHATTATTAASTSRASDLSGNWVAAPGHDANRYDALIRDSAARYGVAPRLIKAMMQQESHFDPNAHSGVGARGLVQIMPGTWRELGGGNAADPKTNIDHAAKYMSQLLARYHGNTENALAAYNWGMGNVDRALRSGHGLAGARMPSETRGYLHNVLNAYNGVSYQ